jgi:hypothetical protein
LVGRLYWGVLIGADDEEPDVLECAHVKLDQRGKDSEEKWWTNWRELIGGDLMFS